jgi:predicted nucleic acid-binding protein
MYLLDTDVISALRRRDRIEPRVLAWIDATPDTDLFISSVTILEIEYGALLRHRRDEAQGALFIDWIRRLILPSFAGRIIAFDTAIALRCAALHVPDRRPERDAMIAATGLEHRLIVVTRNSTDFRSMGVPVLNPWTNERRA